MRAVRVQEYGGPEAMRVEELPTPEPGEGQVLIRTEAAGVNFIDIYQRSGMYKVPLPFPMGLEGAGTVEVVGPDAGEVRVGQRVAWNGNPGSYATNTVVAAEKLVPLPESVSARDGAALMLQGMTAHYLTHSTFPLEPGNTCLIHAAAGGVGLLLTQMAKIRGARVIGTVGTEAKAELAREAGADAVIIYTRENFEAEVKRLTGGKGVEVVYDGVGKDTFEGSLNCLAPRGYMVLFGAASGPVPPLELQVLNTKGSLFVTRPSLGAYTASRDELLGRAEDIFLWVVDGRLKVRIDRDYSLEEAGRAHEDLNGRKTTGKLLIVP